MAFRTRLHFIVFLAPILMIGISINLFAYGAATGAKVVLVNGIM
jgi:hypothetical protein